MEMHFGKFSYKANFVKVPLEDFKMMLNFHNQIYQSRETLSTSKRKPFKKQDLKISSKLMVYSENRPLQITLRFVLNDNKIFL